jgi:hypothetical protein
MLLLGGGCGLDDYAKLMKDEEQRLKEFEDTVKEENSLLGDPLQMPKKLKVREDEKGKPMKDPKGDVIKDEVDALPVAFFLRPPKPIKDTPDKQMQGNLYAYQGGEGLVLYLGATTDSGKTPEDKAKSQENFKKEVCRSLGISTSTPAPPEEKRTLGGRILSFLRMKVKGSPAHLVFLYQKGDEQLAIAFKAPADKLEEEAFRHAVDVSLKTLETGTNAEKLSLAYSGKNFNQVRLKIIRREAPRKRRAP